jgi:Gram-negative bacterial TonB protein C-terminal
MKTARFAIAFALFTLCFIEVPSNAQNRRRLSRSRRSAAVSSKVEMPDAGTPEERARIAEDCAIPGRPMPSVEFGGNALSCGKAISLPKPAYPLEAKTEMVSGSVPVNIAVDEKGRVVWAKAVDGHPLLRGAAVKAACQSWLSPVKISGRAFKASGVIVYNFFLP